MLFSPRTFIGIDPTAGHKPFTYAALDGELRLLALAQGDLEEVTAFAGGQSQAFVAINAPRRPNLGLMADPAVRSQLCPTSRPGVWLDHRVAEVALRQASIHIPRTPADEAACPNWMRMGFQVYRNLERLNYHTYQPNVVPDLETQPCQMLETYPHAAFSVLIERAPFPKHSLEGRIQRQLILHERKVRLADPLEFFEEITRHRLLQGILPLETLHTAAELDALIAAYTAWLVATSPEQTCTVGDASEGLICLPASQLNRRYPEATAQLQKAGW